MKRTISVLLAVIMVFALSATAFAAPAITNPFADSKTPATRAEAIQQVYDAYAKGKSDPVAAYANNKLPVLAKANGLTLATFRARYERFQTFYPNDREPYYVALRWAYCNGLTKDIESGKAKTDSGSFESIMNMSCTRMDIIRFLWRANGAPLYYLTGKPARKILYAQTGAKYKDIDKADQTPAGWAIVNKVCVATGMRFLPNTLCDSRTIALYVSNALASGVGSGVAIGKLR